jgi:hypothetical protein
MMFVVDICKFVSECFSDRSKSLLKRDHAVEFDPVNFASLVRISSPNVQIHQGLNNHIEISNYKLRHRSILAVEMKNNSQVFDFNTSPKNHSTTQVAMNREDDDGKALPRPHQGNYRRFSMIEDDR